VNAEKLVFVGREAEIRSIGERLDEAAAGRGSSVNVRGEPGIGKSVLVEQCAAMARSKGFRVLMGGAAQSGSEPFQVFNRALCGLTDGPLLSGMETASFAGVFFVGRSGDVIAQAVGRDIDPAAIAATMGAVQSFIGDSFRVADGSMGRMTFGTTTVLAEGDQSGMLFGVVLGPEHREMASCISEAAAEIRRGAKAPSETVSGLAAKRFAIRRSPSNMKLSSELNMLADKTLAVIQNATGDSPVLMVFEDMHWADEVSSHVFSYLARISGRLRLLILATSRPGESAEWDGSADAMRQDGVLSVMPLMKLETALVKSLVESRCGPNDFPDEFHERLSRDCDGNPLFIHEVISQMLSDGGIALQGGMHRLSATDFSLPGKVEDLVMGRVSALASPTMALVEMLSCAGKEFPADIADALASSKGASNGMEELAAAGIVEAGEGGFQFRHALFRDAIYKNISPRWKSSHHKAIGEYYEAACGADVAGVIYELARHFHLSNEKRKAVGYCIWAGEAAEAAYAAEKAIEFYGWAQADISAMGASAEDARLQTDLLERAGDMQVLISRYPDAMASFAAAISKVEDRRAKARLHRKTGDVLFRLGDFAGCLDETSKGEAQTDDLEELLLLGFQRAYMLMRQGEYDRSIAMCNDLLERASAFPLSEKITASIFDTLGTNSHRKGDYETALMWYNRSLEMSERAGDLRKMGALYNNIGNVYGDRLLNETSREYYDKAMAIFRKIGDKQAFCVIQGNIGAIHH
jgi:predicted ATPase